jgi:hypothetical protein
MIIKKAFTDRLFEASTHHADLIAEKWYNSLMENPRTTSYKLIPRETCLKNTIYLLKHIEQVYFAENTYQALYHYLDINGFAEDHFARGIPLEEIIYALVLLRRQIFFYSDQQSLANTAEDLRQLVDCVNRIILIFDYITQIVASKYQTLPAQTSKSQHSKVAESFFPDLGKSR